MPKVQLNIVGIGAAVWLLGILIAVDAGADTLDIPAADCAKQVSRKAPAGTLLTVVTTDGNTVCGIYPGYTVSSTALRLQPHSDSAGSSRTIPFDRIDHITFQGSSPFRHVVTLLGLGLGAVAGGAIGKNLASDDDSFMDFGEVVGGLSGAVIGAVIGSVGGNALAKRIKVTVTIRC